nr:hypothetical protein [Streptomyces adelaidensis]
MRASQAEEDGRRRQAGRQVRLRQSMLATLVVLLGLAVTAGGLAYQQREGALDQERVARSQALAVRSASLAGGRPEASMLLAEEAYSADTTAEARGALLSAQAQPFSARLGGYRGPVNTVAFAPDDRTTGRWRWPAPTARSPCGAWPATTTGPSPPSPSPAACARSPSAPTAVPSRPLRRTGR